MQNKLEEIGFYTTSLIDIQGYPLIEIKFKDGKTHTFTPGIHEWDKRKIMKKFINDYYQREKLRKRKDKINKIINAK